MRGIRTIYDTCQRRSHVLKTNEHENFQLNQMKIQTTVNVQVSNITCCNFNSLRIHQSKSIMFLFAGLIYNYVYPRVNGVTFTGDF